MSESLDDLPLQEAAHLKPAKPAIEDLRATRRKRLALSILTSILIRPLSHITTIITVPLFLHYLGKERYGIYETVGALTVYLAMTNAGLSLGLMNRLTESTVNNDRVFARKSVSSLMIALTVIALFASLASIFVVPIVDWSRFLITTDPAGKRELPWAILTAILCLMLSQITTTGNWIYAGLQETHKANIWDAVARGFALVASLAICRWTDWGVVGVLLGISGAPVLVRAVNLVYMFALEKPWLAPSLEFFEWKLVVKTMAEGMMLLVLQLSNVLLYQADKLVIAYLLGTQEVAGYSVVGRIFTLIYGCYAMLLAPLWPATGEALRRGDFAWVRRSQIYTQICGVGFVLGCGAAFLWAGPRIFELLKKVTGGESVEVPKTVIVAITLTFAARASVDCFSLILVSMGNFRSQLWLALAAAVVNVTLAVILGNHWGLVGVAWATPIATALTIVWGYPWLTSRFVRQLKQNQEAATPVTVL